MVDRARERASVCGVHVKTGVVIGTAAQVLAILLGIAVCVVLLTVVGNGRVRDDNDTGLNDTDEASRILDANETHFRFYERTYPIITTNDTNLSLFNSSSAQPFQFISTYIHLAFLGFWLLTIPLLLLSLPCERSDLILANIFGDLFGVLMAVAQIVIFILRLVHSDDDKHDRAIFYICIFVLLATVIIAGVGLLADARWYGFVQAKNGTQCICCCEQWPEEATTEGGGVSTNGAAHRNGHDHRVIEAPAEEIPIQQFSRF